MSLDIGQDPIFPITFSAKRAEYLAAKSMTHPYAQETREPAEPLFRTNTSNHDVARRLKWNNLCVSTSVCRYAGVLHGQSLWSYWWSESAPTPAHERPNALHRPGIGCQVHQLLRVPTTPTGTQESLVVYHPLVWSSLKDSFSVPVW